MKKTLAFFSLLLLMGMGFQAQASKYKIDQTNLDQMMVNAHQIEALSIFDLPDAGTVPDNQIIAAEKDPIVALLLCTFLGWVGGHRFYMGTKTINCLFYFLLSCVGIGGILVAIDWIFLLLVVIDKKDLSPYLDNPKFIMWKDQL
jgi:TM2 domain-containing membrane protein YozV